MSAYDANQPRVPASCSCASFNRLEGASVQAYICAFLRPAEPAAAGSGEFSQAHTTHYRCGVCGRAWEKLAAEAGRPGARPSLVRQD